MSVIIKSNFALGNNQGLYNINKLIFDVFHNSDNGKIYKIALNVYLNTEVHLKISSGTFCTELGVDMSDNITIVGDNTLKYAWLKIKGDGILELVNAENIISLGSSISPAISFFSSESVIDSINATSFVAFNVIQMNNFNSKSSAGRMFRLGNLMYLYGNAINLNKTNLERFNWVREGLVTSDRADLPTMYGEIQFSNPLLNLSITNVSQLSAPLHLKNIPNTLVLLDIRLNKNLDVLGDWSDLKDSMASSILLEGNKSTIISGSLNSLNSRVGIFQTDARYTGAYESRDWGASFNKFWYRGEGLTTAMIDQILMDLSNVPTWTGDKSIRLKGTRSTISDPHVAILNSNGVNVAMI